MNEEDWKNSIIFDGNEIYNIYKNAWLNRGTADWYGCSDWLQDYICLDLSSFFLLM